MDPRREHWIGEATCRSDGCAGCEEPCSLFLAVTAIRKLWTMTCSQVMRHQLVFWESAIRDGHEPVLKLEFESRQDAEA